MTKYCRFRGQPCGRSSLMGVRCGVRLTLDTGVARLQIGCQVLGTGLVVVSQGRDVEVTAPSARAAAVQLLQHVGRTRDVAVVT